VDSATNDSVVDQTDNSLSHVQPAAEEEKPQRTRYMHIVALHCLLNLVSSLLGTDIESQQVDPENRERL